MPGDKSISHRALLLSMMAMGRSRITGLSQAADVKATRAAIEALGAQVKEDDQGIYVDGVGTALQEPAQVIDVGNSGTLMRLLTGVLAPAPGRLFFLTGDSSIVHRPMARVIDPLSAMGASILGRHENQFAPLLIQGRTLQGITISMSTPSAQVKSALILAGLSADGETVIIESEPTRAHTEEMAPFFGAHISREFDGEFSSVIRVVRSVLRAHDVDVAGDPSAAAFFVVLGLIGAAPVHVNGVYLGPEREGFIEVLRAMGARIDVAEQGPGLYSVSAHPSELNGVDVGPNGIPGLIDEVPILAVAAARARGVTRFFGVGELRFKESDRIATTVAMLEAFGVHCQASADSFEVTGSSQEATHKRRSVESNFDHRIAMSAAIMASVHRGTTTINGFESVETSFPGFLDVLAECGIRASVDKEHHHKLAPKSQG